MNTYQTWLPNNSSTTNCLKLTALVLVASQLEALIAHLMQHYFVDPFFIAIVFCLEYFGLVEYFDIENLFVSLLLFGAFSVFPFFGVFLPLLLLWVSNKTVIMEHNANQKLLNSNNRAHFSLEKDIMSQVKKDLVAPPHVTLFYASCVSFCVEPSAEIELPQVKSDLVASSRVTTLAHTACVSFCVESSLENGSTLAARNTTVSHDDVVSLNYVDCAPISLPPVAPFVAVDSALYCYSTSVENSEEMYGALLPPSNEFDSIPSSGADNALRSLIPFPPVNVNALVQLPVVAVVSRLGNNCDLCCRWHVGTACFGGYTKVSFAKKVAPYHRRCLEVARRRRHIRRSGRLEKETKRRLDNYVRSSTSLGDASLCVETATTIIPVECIPWETTVPIVVSSAPPAPAPVPLLSGGAASSLSCDINNDELSLLSDDGPNENISLPTTTVHDAVDDKVVSDVTKQENSDILSALFNRRHRQPTSVLEQASAPPPSFFFTSRR